MALGNLPPWLSVQPSDFVHAAAAGAQLGHAIADSTLRAWEEQARMRMAAQEAQANREQHAQQVAVENAMNRLAADRLEAYRQSEIANRKAELGLQQQGLGLRGESVDITRQRAEDLSKNTEQRIKDSEERERDRQSQRDFMNEMRQREADRRDKEMERREKEFETRQSTLQPHYFQGPDGKQYMIQRGGTNAVEVPLSTSAKETSSGGGLWDAYKGIMGLGAKVSGLSNFLPTTPSTPKTNTVPNVGVSYAPQETQAAPPPSQAPASKVDKANALYKKHPDWTKQQIIDAVNSGVE